MKKITIITNGKKTCYKTVKGAQKRLDSMKYNPDGIYYDDENGRHYIYANELSKLK